MEKEIIFISFIFWVNGFNYWMVNTLKDNEYPTKHSYVWNHFRDIPKIFHLANKTDSPLKKVKYYFFGIGLILGIIAFPIAVFLLISRDQI